MLAAHRLPLCALFLVLATIPVSHAAPGETLFSWSGGTISGTAGGALHHVYTTPADGEISSETCVVSTIVLSASASGFTSGITKASDYNVWAATTYSTVSEDVAALKAKFLTNSVCEGSAFADTSCTSDAVSLSPDTYVLVMVNAQTSDVTVSSALITECTEAQHATLGHDHDHASGASRHLTQTFTSAALAVGALALV